MDVFNQTTKLICVCDVLEKALSLPLLLQWLKFFQNLPQFPGDLCLSVLSSILGNVPSPSQFLSPYLLLNITI